MEHQIGSMTLENELENIEDTSEVSRIESFSIRDDFVSRRIRIDGIEHSQSMDVEGIKSIYDGDDLRKLWWLSRIRGRVPFDNVEISKRRMRIVDLFSGCGGLVTGTRWACEGLGFKTKVVMASEIFKPAIDVYRKNHSPRDMISENVANLVEYEEAEDGLTNIDLVDNVLAGLVDRVDILVAGPPCQGNSNLNNKTRRSDSRNELYVSAIAIAIALNSKIVIIENVPEVGVSDQNVVMRSRNTLQKYGYSMTEKEIKLDASNFGTAQSRKRHFTIGIKNGISPSLDLLEQIKCEKISCLEAICDLEGKENSSNLDIVAELSDENKRRIDYLFDNDLYELPASERPECHDDDNTYPSIYGRMYPTIPSPTLSTGFMSPGRGRYIHPNRRRCLTPHEGARIQGFPDDYCFETVSGEQIPKTHLARLIGDAVPTQLAYVVALIGIAAHIKSN